MATILAKKQFITGIFLPISAMEWLMQCFYCMAESLIYGYRFLKGRLCCSAVGQCLPEMEYTMSPLKTISEKLAAWRRYRDAVRELSQLSNRELDDIGIRRGDIEFIVRRSVASQVSA